jgi:hypothetical protein
MLIIHTLTVCNPVVVDFILDVSYALCMCEPCMHSFLLCMPDSLLKLQSLRWFPMTAVSVCMHLEGHVRTTPHWACFSGLICWSSRHIHKRATIPAGASDVPFTPNAMVNTIRLSIITVLDSTAGMTGGHPQHYCVPGHAIYNTASPWMACHGECGAT